MRLTFQLNRKSRGHTGSMSLVNERIILIWECILHMHVCICVFVCACVCACFFFMKLTSFGMFKATDTETVHLQIDIKN